MVRRKKMLHHFFDKTKKLKQQLNHANTYEEWKEIATLLDAMDEIQAWKTEDESAYFDTDLIQYRLKRLIKYQQQNRTQDLLFLLQEAMTHDVGYICHPLLYTVAYTGTKNLIEQYIHQVCQALNYLHNSAELTATQKKEFFSNSLKTYGQPALMFSGGATLGLFHSGVCKALKEHNFLPRILSGSSAGAVMAAMMSSQDAEYLLSGEVALNEVFQFRSLKNLLNEDFTGFTDIAYLKRFLIDHLGDMTFKEAYLQSNLEINIAVAPYQTSQIPRILNRYTSPDVLVWSAVLASCAIPVLFPPVQLTAKQIDGSYVPFMGNTRWVDGSMRSDFPQEKMTRLYNINYTIASQANPHVVPFMQEDQARFRHDLLSWPERIARRQGKVIARGMMDFTRERMDAVPPIRRLLDHGYGIINQQYYGDINIIGKYNLKHYSYLLKNPRPHLFKQLQKEGERATWAKMAMIETHAKIGNLLEELANV